MFGAAVVIAYFQPASCADVAPSSESSQQDGVRLAELKSPVTNAYGSAKSAYQPSLGHIGICSVAVSHFVYAVVVWNCLRVTVMPMLARLDWTRAAILGKGSVWSTTITTFLHADASQTPSWFVSYLESIIAALALSADPASFGVAYGS